MDTTVVMSVPVLVSVLSTLLVLCSSQVTLNLPEGAICKKEDGKNWICKDLYACPKALELLEQEVIPQVCSYKGKTPIVCCKETVGEIAEKMCKKYSEIEITSDPNDRTGLMPGHKVTGGVDADPKEFPHQAVVEFDKTDDSNPFCGGSLISDRYVLSAAHCSYSIKGEPKWVRLGDYNIYSAEDEKLGKSQPVKYEIIESFPHPDYRSPKVYNDIILYKLNTSVEYTEFVKPLCLNTEYEFPVGTYVATGWGMTNWGGRVAHTIQKVNLTINSRQECENYYRINKREGIEDGLKDEIMFCTRNKGVGTCKGDSGGPFQVRHPKYNKMYLQLGITSSGPMCQFNYNDVYVRVSHYISWIENIVWPDGE